MEDDHRAEDSFAAHHEAEEEVEAAPEDVEQPAHHDGADSAALHSEVEGARQETLAPRPSAWGSHTERDAATRCLKA